MWRFICKVVVFLLPLALLFAFPVAVFILSREAYPTKLSVSLQAVHPEIVVGKAFYDANNGLAYKQALIAQRDPQIVFVGSSRTMEFRKEFFKDPSMFINAAFGAANTTDMGEIVTALPDQTKLLVIGLDQKVFKPGYEPAVIQDSASLSEMVTDFVSYDWREIYFDYIRTEFTVHKLAQRFSSSGDIGLTALIKGDGYRGDGSYQYEFELSNQSQQKTLAALTAAAISSLHADRGSFQYGTTTSQRALDELDQALAEAHAKHIAVIGFLPPYEPAIRQELFSKNDTYSAEALALPREIKQIFAKYGYEVFDFSDVSMFPQTEHEYINEDHPTDKLDLRMLVYMAQHSPNMRSYVDIPRDQALIGAVSGDFLPFDLSVQK